MTNKRVFKMLGGIGKHENRQSTVLVGQSEEKLSEYCNEQIRLALRAQLVAPSCLSSE